MTSVLTMGREGSLQESALKYLNSLPGCVAENVSGNSHQSGRPDINGCINGRMFKIELKVPDHKYAASKKQSLNLRRWKRSGAIVAVVYSLSFLKKVFQSEGFPWSAGYHMEIEDNDCVSWAEIPEV